MIAVGNEKTKIKTKTSGSIDYYLKKLLVLKL